MPVNRGWFTYTVIALLDVGHVIHVTPSLLGQLRPYLHHKRKSMATDSLEVFVKDEDTWANWRYTEVRDQCDGFGLR